MRLFMMDRDGVVVVNRSDNIKRPSELEFIPGCAEALARLTEAGFKLAICTNQPEVARGAMSLAQLQDVHEALRELLARRGARIDRICTCTGVTKSPRRKPAAGMLREALREFGAVAGQTAFVGDQTDDLKAAFHAGCRRVLVRTGLGEQALRQGLPLWVGPVAVHEDLMDAVEAELKRPVPEQPSCLRHVA